MARPPDRTGVAAEAGGDRIDQEYRLRMRSRRPRNRDVVGVAIDGDLLRGVQVQRRMGEIHAIAACEVEIDAATTDQGRVVDGDALVEGLRALWATGGFTTKQVAFGIDGRDATFRRLRVPRAAAEDLESAVRYELGEYLPYGIDEAVTSIHEVGRTDSDVDVVAVAVRVSTAEQLVDLVARAGLKLAHVTLASTAQGTLAPGDHNDAIVTVDGSSTTILVRRGGRARVARVLSAGGGNRSAQVADEIAQAIATVDRFRSGDENQAHQEDAQLRRYRAAAHEVAAAIRFELTEQGAGEALDSVVLTGPYSDVPALHEYMAAEVDAPVTVLATPAWWKADAAFHDFIDATGVARAAVDGRAEGAMCLDPPSAVVRRTAQRELVIGLVAALAVAMGAVHLVISTQDRAREIDSQAIDAESLADVSAARLESLDDLVGLQLEVENAQRLVADAVGGEIAWPRLFDQIASDIPGDTFFTGVSLRQPSPDAVDLDQDTTTASFTGIALDQAGVARWLLAVEAIPGIDEVWLLQSTATVFGEDELPVVAFIAEAQLTDELLSERAEALGDPGGGGEVTS